MGTDKRTHRTPLKPEWADALLAAPDKDGRPLSLRLHKAREELQQAVAAAQEAISKNPLSATVAGAAVRELGKRGQPGITVDTDGVVMLEVHYSAETRARPTDRPVRGWHSDLPSLEILRREAVALGINVEGMGRSKHLLQAAITRAKAAQPEGQPRPKRVKTAPAIGPVTVLNPATEGKVVPFAPAGDLPPDLLDEPTKH